jgi:predicted nucleotidyltransferase
VNAPPRFQVLREYLLPSPVLLLPGNHKHEEERRRIDQVGARARERERERERETEMSVSLLEFEMRSWMQTADIHARTHNTHTSVQADIYAHARTRKACTQRW